MTERGEGWRGERWRGGDTNRKVKHTVQQRTAETDFTVQEVCTCKQWDLVNSNPREPAYVSRGLLLSMPTMYNIKGAEDFSQQRFHQVAINYTQSCIIADVSLFTIMAVKTALLHQMSSTRSFTVNEHRKSCE